MILQLFYESHTHTHTHTHTHATVLSFSRMRERISPAPKNRLALRARVVVIAIVTSGARAVFKNHPSLRHPRSLSTFSVLSSPRGPGSHPKTRPSAVLSTPLFVQAARVVPCSRPSSPSAVSTPILVQLQEWSRVFVQDFDCPQFCRRLSSPVFSSVFSVRSVDAYPRPAARVVACPRPRLRLSAVLSMPVLFRVLVRLLRPQCRRLSSSSCKSGPVSSSKTSTVRSFVDACPRPAARVVPCPRPRLRLSAVLSTPVLSRVLVRLLRPQCRRLSSSSCKSGRVSSSKTLTVRSFVDACPRPAASQVVLSSSKSLRRP